MTHLEAWHEEVPAIPRFLEVLVLFSLHEPPECGSLSPHLQEVCAKPVDQRGNRDGYYDEERRTALERTSKALDESCSHVRHGCTHYLATYKPHAPRSI